MPDTVVGINVFATAIAVEARIDINRHRMPDFAGDPELIRISGDRFRLDRLPDLVAQLPKDATWEDIGTLLRSFATAHLEPSDDTRRYISGSFHYPEGTDPSTVYLSP